MKKKVTLDDLYRAGASGQKMNLRALQDQVREQSRSEAKEALETERQRKIAQIFRDVEAGYYDAAEAPDPPPEPTEWECKACHKHFTDWKTYTEHPCRKASELRTWEKQNTRYVGLMTPR